MEQRQPDEPNEPRIDPSPQQPPDSQRTITNDASPPVEQPAAGGQDVAPGGDAPQTPNQRGNRQQNGRNNGGQRGNRPDRNDRDRGDGPGPRNEAVPRNDRNGEPRDGQSEPAEQNGTGSSPQPETQRGQSQQNTHPRGDGPRGNRNGRDRSDGPGGPGTRNENRTGNRDRPGPTRERSPDNRGRDDRYRTGIADGAADLRDADGPENPATDFQGRDDRLVIGISLGDYNGIGPEVILKALQYNRLQKICTPVIYGSMRILNRYRNLLDLKDWNLNGVPAIGQISHKLTNVITCWPDQNQEIQPGQVTPEAGQAALICLQRAVDDLKDGKLDALVTAPINKYNIQSEEFQFPGHTEYLAQQFDMADNLMFMVSDILRVGVVTGHVPLGRVRQNVTRERIAQKLTLMTQSLKQDFGIEKPKIAVLGLNPHAGEEGLLGNEEQDIIKPLLTDLRNKGQLVFGPYPADGFFGTRNYKNFDAVLAMYHDQGLIPFKAIAFEEGVNFTAGMPIVRTSPDHGTAYDIAGKDLADETSMLQAIYTAVDVARQRKEFLELEAGALRKQSAMK